MQGSGSRKDVQKEKTISKKSPAKKDAPLKDTNAEASAPTPFIFAPQIKQGKPVLVTDSIRANPRLALPVLQGVCLPEDMKQLLADLEGNIVDMFSHLALVSFYTEVVLYFLVFA